MKHIKPTDFQNILESLLAKIAQSDDTIQALSEDVIILIMDLKTRRTCEEIRRVWTPRDEVMDFLKFKDTRISEITKMYELTTAEIGKRKFYRNDSLLRVLEENIIHGRMK
jgi:hypothetical protein